MESLLVPEGAAHEWLDDPDTVAWQRQDRRELVAQHVCLLGRCPHREDALGWVPARQRGMRLHRHRVRLAGLEPLPDDQVGLPEGGLDVARAGGLPPADVALDAGDALVQAGGVRSQRGLARQDEGQLLVDDIDELGGGASGLGVVREDGRDRLPHEADPIPRPGRPGP